MVQKENKQTESIFKEVYTKENSLGEFKAQFTFEVSPWDTSTMEGHKSGDKVLTGYSLSIKTLKPDKKYPRQRVDLDITDDNVRALLVKAIKAYESTLKK
jgi:hypothetical protein